MKYISFDDVIEEIDTRRNSYRLLGRLSSDLSDFITEVIDVIYDMDAIYINDEVGE